jgi:hypothetical protein
MNEADDQSPFLDLLREHPRSMWSLVEELDGNPETQAVDPNEGQG